MKSARSNRALARAALLVGGVFVAGAPAPSSLEAQPYDEFELTARVWLDRGEEPVLGRGERVRLYYRTNADAYVSIFQIDTNGTVRLLFPRTPDENHYVRGGRDYRLLFPRSSWWTVEDDPGVGYFFAVASPEPFDFGAFGFRAYQGGWDLTRVGRAVYSDPYVAMDDYIALLIPDWEYVAYALDFTSYHVERRYEYPRFLCYDCHGFRPYAAWNPYFYTCTTYRVVVFDDPYYYPVSRYRGDRVVWVRPSSPGQPRFVFKERARGEPGSPMVTPRRELLDRDGVARGDRAVPRRSVEPLGRSLPGSAQPRTLDRPTGAEPRAASPPIGGRPVPTGRPTDALPERGRPVLERRPPARGGVPTRGGSAGPARSAGPPSGAVVPARPPARGGGTGTARPTPPRGGGDPPARPPTARRPPGGGGGGGASPPARATPPPRGGGGGSSPPARPTTRRPGGGWTPV